MVFVRDMSFIGLVGVVSAWSILAMIRALIARRNWEAPDRQAIPEAGRSINTQI